MSFRCFLWLGGWGEDLEDGRGQRGWKRESGRTGAGLGGGWESTLRGRKRTERMGNGLGGRRNETLRERKQGLGERRNGLREGRKRDFEKEKKGNRESCDSIAVFS